MSLLLQLNADLPERFPHHERRLYIWACRRRPCKRKPGAIRAVRNVRQTSGQDSTSEPAEKPVDKKQAVEPKLDLGAQLFGGGGMSASPSGNPFASSNPFSMGGGGGGAVPGSNPFSMNPVPSTSTSPSNNPSLKPTSEATEDEESLPATFAQKARITDPSTDTLPHPSPSSPSPPYEPWPTHPSPSTPESYPPFYLDAETEYLSPTKNESSSREQDSRTAFLDTPAGAGEAPDSGDVSALPDDSIDRTFQHFADTLAQNPEQALRYDFGGAPLLYRRDDDVGRAIHPHISGGDGKVRVAPATGKSGMPSCPHCRAPRVLELQLVPGAIAALEEDMPAARVLAEGMEWGTIIVGVCSADCCGSLDGASVAREEWVGVQWEEVVQRGGGGKSKGKGK